MRWLPRRKPGEVALDFDQLAGVALGERGADERGEYIECSFELPAGSFATIVMNEVMKEDVQDRRPW